MAKLSATWRVQDDIAPRFRGYARFGKIRNFRKSEIVYQKGDIDRYFYYVLSGAVLISMTNQEGGEITLEAMGPDSLFGEGPAFDGLPKYTSVSALKDSSVIQFDAANLTAAIAEAPEFFTDLMAIAGMKQRVLAIKLEHFAARDPTLRIVELLIRLSVMFGRKSENGFLIENDFTHEQIASLTGTTRVTVTRVLNRLRGRNLIGRTGHHLWIASRNPDDYV